jgi:hypothetical protein
MTDDIQARVEAVLSEHRLNHRRPAIPGPGEAWTCTCGIFHVHPEALAAHDAHVAAALAEAGLLATRPEPVASGWTPCRRSTERNRWECITWPGKATAYPCAHDHAHCDYIGCVEHIDGMHVDFRGDAIVHVGCGICRPDIEPEWVKHSDYRRARDERDAALSEVDHPRPEPVDLTDVEGKALAESIERAFLNPATWSVSPDALAAVAKVVARIKADAYAVLARVEAVHGRYFDLDGTPGVDDTTPEPEDVWRYDRDFRAALADPEEVPSTTQAPQK